jgi:hypothetical protein
VTDNRQGFSCALRIGAGLAARLQAGFCLLAVAMSALAATDNASAVLERRVKAALLYRFLNYVEWPESALPPANAPFTIGIVGADALAAELAEFVTGRTVQNHPLAVRTLPASEPVGNVQVMFVGQTEAAQLGVILRSAPPNALIVTESDESLALGSVINFLLVDGQVRFDVSLEAARRRGLRLSARLLSVAHSVQGAQP